MARKEHAPANVARALAIVLLAACAHTAARGQTQTASDAPARPVALTVTVTDAQGRFVTGLTRESFLVYEEKAERAVESFGGAEGPLSVGIVFDMSASVTYSARAADEARHALLDFARRGDRANEYFVLGFNKELRLLADWTRDTDVVADGLNELASMQSKGKGRTALYDALYEGLTKFGGASNARRVLLVVSDGADNASRHEFSEVRRLAASTGALVYALGVFNDAQVSTGASVDAQRRLEALCRAAGGRTFYTLTYRTAWEARVARAPEPDAEVRRSLETVETELRNQYAITFTPVAPAPGDRLRRVEVRVRAPQKSDKTFPARAREGYLPAPAAH